MTLFVPMLMGGLLGAAWGGYAAYIKPRVFTQDRPLETVMIAFAGGCLGMAIGFLVGLAAVFVKGGY